VRNGDGGWCTGVARWRVQGGAGPGVVCLQNARRGAGGPKKNRNRAAVARFWAAVGLQEVERGAVGLWPPLPC
jgi:hypothetical protein